MPLPLRQLWFLRVAAASGVATIVIGLWNYSLSGAVRELVSGAAIVALAWLCAWRWRRPGEEAAEK